MNSEITAFYANRSILVTGVTGFLGKVLVEKLLRSIPEIKSIYVLIRPMHNVDASQRLKKVLESDLFDHLNAINEKSIFSKIIAVNGDITEPELRLSPDDVKTLRDQVSVVFHCAATVKFDEHMRQAVKMNIEGTKNLLQLCQGMKQLRAFVHTSTAYCNCDRTYVVERVYPSPIHWQKLIKVIDWMDDSMLDRLTPFCIGARPNSYTFTKAVAESMLVDPNEPHSRLPIIIVRPSIITATWKEPKPGWLENYNGATGVLALAAKGLIKTLYGRLQEVRTDLVPADVVVNMLIVCGWYRSINPNVATPVVHCTTSRLNPVTSGQVMDQVMHNFKHKMPLANLYRVPGGKITVWRLEHKIRWYLIDLLPAYVLDLLAPLFGRKRRMVKLYNKVSYVIDSLEYFYTNQWDFQSKMAVILNNQLSETDRRLFYIDMTRMDWSKYFDDYHWGLRKYVLKEDSSNLNLARKIHYRRRVLIRGVQLMILVLFLLRIIFRRVSIGKLFRLIYQ